MEDAVKLYSTAFVFLSDTFTGEFLCGFYLMFSKNCTMDEVDGLFLE
jgi:hypothetical protein